MSWADRPLVGLDLETTDEDPFQARIVTATLVLDGPNTSPTVTSWMADPGIEIPAAATRLHGVTTATAREFGRPASDVVDEIRLALRAAWSTGPVVIYNGSYDLTVVGAEAARHHLPPFEVSGPVIDPYIIDRALDPHRHGRHTLTATCAHYGVNQGRAHDSTADALAAVHLAVAMARRWPLARNSSAQELHELTARWNDELQLRLGRASGWPVRGRRRAHNKATIAGPPGTCTAQVGRVDPPPGRLVTSRDW